MTPEEFERHRRKTIELLHPAEVAYLQECADLVRLSYEELLEEATEHVHHRDHLVYRGSDMSYESIDWDRFWKAFFLITNTLPTDEHPQWGFFTCSC